MNKLAPLIFALTAGIFLGTVFFGGLWWTIRKSLESSKTAVWLVGSKFFRMLFVLSGFYLVGAGNWERMLACLLGFSIARIAVVFLTGHPRGLHES